MDTPEPGPDDTAASPAPASYPPPEPRAAGRPPGRPWTIAGFVFAVLAFLFAPIYAGAIGVFCGVMGLRKGDPLGKTAALTATGCMVAAIALYVVIRS